MINDHAPRLYMRAAENASMEELEKRTAPLFWLVFMFAVAVLVGLRAYDAGRASLQRVCPAAQQGERLLSTEQLQGKTVCSYAEGEAGYAHTIKRREVKS